MQEEKDEEGSEKSGNGIPALSLAMGIKANGDFPLRLTSSVMIGPTAACLDMYCTVSSSMLNVF